MPQNYYHLPTATSMEQFGAAIAQAVADQALTIFLCGDLGVGKTTLVRGFLRALGYLGHVNSPTFSLVEIYPLLKRTVVHFDLYRLECPQDLAAIGWRDYFDGMHICLVEWPEYAGTETAEPDLVCKLSLLDAARTAVLSATTAMGETVLNHLL